jgi:hypothetical protein
LAPRGFQEAIWYYRPLDCLKDRQTAPPRINRGYPRDRRFLLKRLRVISFPFNVDALFRRCLLKASLHNQQRLLKKWGGQILRDRSIELIKWRKAGLENLPISPCLKGIIRVRALRDYRRGEHKNSPYPFNFAPITKQFRRVVTIEDYRQKY